MNDCCLTTHTHTHTHTHIYIYIYIYIYMNGPRVDSPRSNISISISNGILTLNRRKERQDKRIYTCRNI